MTREARRDHSRLFQWITFLMQSYKHWSKHLHLPSPTPLVGRNVSTIDFQFCIMLPTFLTMPEVTGTHSLAYYIKGGS